MLDPRIAPHSNPIINNSVFIFIVFSFLHFQNLQFLKFSKSSDFFSFKITFSASYLRKQNKELEYNGARICLFHCVLRCLIIWLFKYKTVNKSANNKKRDCECSINSASFCTGSSTEGWTAKKRNKWASWRQINGRAL